MFKLLYRMIFGIRQDVTVYWLVDGRMYGTDNFSYRLAKGEQSIFLAPNTPEHYNINQDELVSFLNLEGQGFDAENDQLYIGASNGGVLMVDDDKVDKLLKNAREQ